MANRSPSNSSTTATGTSTRSEMTGSTSKIGSRNTLKDQYLSTVLEFDRENNIFGLANDPVLSDFKVHKKLSKPDHQKPVFYQTPIVMYCCPVVCFKHKTQSDLPMSIKCRKCFLCTTLNKSCSACGEAGCLNRCVPPCPTSHIVCGREPKCSYVDCSGRVCGMKMVVNRKNEYPPAEIELVPKSSSELHKPLTARKCEHSPACVGPSSCFPYLMPCHWPGRPGAPCSLPGRCFHNPPCPPPRNKYPCDTTVCEKISAFTQQVQTPCKDCPNMPKKKK